MFQWGATEGNDYNTDAKDYSTWATAPFNNGASDYDSIYFESVKDEVCPNGVLSPQYDAAYVATNGVAHMPTKEQLDELTANTTVEWLTEFNGVSGVNGIKFTASNGNYIFIPASGNTYKGIVKDRGSRGRVWSSSLFADPHNYAWDLRFDSSKLDMSNLIRYFGCSVRGVVNKN